MYVIGLLLGIFGILGVVKSWKESEQKRAGLDDFLRREKGGAKITREEYVYAAQLADQLGLVKTSMVLRSKEGV